MKQILLFLVLVPAAHAQSVRHQATLLPQAPFAAQHAGAAVAIRGTLAFVGEPDSGLAATGAGAVEYWQLLPAGWILRGVFVASDAVSGDHFGAALACTGTTLIVGAPGVDAHGTDSGAVYSYDLTGGAMPPIELQKLAPSDTQAGDAYGSSIALEINSSSAWKLAVGAPNANTGAAQSGAVYVYQRAAFATNWTLLKKHGHPAPHAGAHFGAALAINDSYYQRLVVGAPDDDDAGSLSGSVWQGAPSATQLTKLTIPALAAGDHAGAAVALAAGRTCVGVPGCDTPSTDAGRVCTFDGTGFLLGVLQPAAVNAGDGFGSRMAGDFGDRYLISAPGDDGAALDAGAVYLFAGTGNQLAREAAPSPYAGQHFGDSISYSAFSTPTLALVGDPHSALAATDAGATEVFVVADPTNLYPQYCVSLGSGTFPACPCSSVPIDRGCPNSAGGGAQLSGSGIPSVACDTLTLTVTGLPTSSVGLLVQSWITANAVQNGDGRSCIGAAPLRLLVAGTTTGVLQFGSGTGQLPLSLAGNLPPGGGNVANYQLYYRDSANFCTSATWNFSNGLSIGWGP